MKANRIIGAALVISGVVWAIGFPKSGVLELGFVRSAALAVGLIGTGILTALATRSRFPVFLLSTIMLWSLLFNGYYAFYVHHITEIELQRLTFAREHAKILDANPDIRSQFEQYRR